MIHQEATQNLLMNPKQESSGISTYLHTFCRLLQNFNKKLSLKAVKVILAVKNVAKLPLREDLPYAQVLIMTIICF